MIRSAEFSEDGKKRYELVRDWGDERLCTSARSSVTFVMLNPSVANACYDDPTVRKCIGFAKRWGFSRLVVTNLIADIATDPWQLPAFSGIDMRNRAVMQAAMGSTDLVVAAWGGQPPPVARRIGLADLVVLARQCAPVDLYCIGLTKHGSPLHPSRAGYTNAPIPFEDGR